jgi:asparagine synthetase B (glutamine-hydrolysing)
MCGIFGWVAHDNTIQPDRQLLQWAAAGAAARGPHAHGWAIPGQPTHRALGQLNLTTLPRTGIRILGHARLATYGQPTDLAAVQPIEVDGHHLVHNGNATTAYHDHPHAPSDTAALAAIYAAHRLTGAPPAAALTHTAAHIDTVWALAVLDADGSLLVSRHGLPLHILHTHTGVYLSSGPIPGSQLVPEHYTWQLAANHQTLINAYH